MTKKQTAGTPGEGVPAKPGASAAKRQGKNTTKPAPDTTGDIDSAVRTAVDYLEDIIFQLDDGQNNHANQLGEQLREDLGLVPDAIRPQVLSAAQAWIATHANGRGPVLRELAGLGRDPSDATALELQDRVTIAKDAIAAAAQATSSQDREERFKAVMKLIATLGPYALADIKPLVMKAAHITSRQFDELLKAEERAASATSTPRALQASEEELRSKYIVRAGAHHAIEQANGERYPKALCNFNAKIVEDVTQDDGQTITRRFVIDGWLSDGQRLPRVQVDAAQFSSMNWVMTQWGVRAVVNAGQSAKDKLREAIQLEAVGTATRPTVYTHTGWRDVDGHWVYLTAAGAVGSNQPITVKLDGQLSRYALPTSLEGVSLKKAMAASLRSLAVANQSITFALWGAMYLAPLAALQAPDFVVWLFGESGSLKSTLAALFLSHFGDFTYKTLPEGWESTENAIEKKCFLVKDAPLVIDDFAPQMMGTEAQRIEKSAQRIIRAVGNQTPRNRLNADTSDRLGFKARGLVIATGEQLPSTASIMARLLPLEVKREWLHVGRLTKAQTETALYQQAMAGYILWLAGQWGELPERFSRRVIELRAELSDGTKHLRNATTFAMLLAAIELGLAYAETTGALTGEKRVEYFDLARAELRGVSEAQAEHVRKERPSIRFLEIIRNLVQQGKAYFAPLRKPDTGGSGELLGVYDDDFLYPLADATMHTVKEYCRREGDPFPLKATALYDMLEVDGVLIKGAGQSTTNLRIGPTQKRVMKLHRAKVEII